MNAEFWKGAASFEAFSLGLFVGRKALAAPTDGAQTRKARTLTMVMRIQPIATSHGINRELADCDKHGTHVGTFR
jgi:hypothetical protein